MISGGCDPNADGTASLQAGRNVPATKLSNVVWMQHGFPFNWTGTTDYFLAATAIH